MQLVMMLGQKAFSPEARAAALEARRDKSKGERRKESKGVAKERRANDRRAGLKMGSKRDIAKARNMERPKAPGYRASDAKRGDVIDSKQRNYGEDR